MLYLNIVEETLFAYSGVYTELPLPPSDHVGKTKRSSCLGEVYKAHKIQNLLEQRGGGGEGFDFMNIILQFSF